MYSPVMMRFVSSDRLSPFGKGGINAYAYCLNDPINCTDPSGRFPIWLSPVRNIVSGVLNLGISVVKAFRGYMQAQDFNLNTGYPGTRSGVVPSLMSENMVPRWSTRDTVVTAVGSITATMGIGTSIGRLSTQGSDALMWIDTSLAMIATAMSAYELVTIARLPMDSRYNIHLQQVTGAPV